MGHSTVAGNRESAVLSATGTTKKIFARCSYVVFVVPVVVNCISQNEKSRRELRLFGYASKRCLEHVFDRGGFVEQFLNVFADLFAGVIGRFDPLNDFV